MTAQHYDCGKPPVEQLPFIALEQVARVLEFGAAKYGVNNWKQGMPWSKLLGSALRHLFTWAVGDTYDTESGLNHLAHAATDILFLLHYAEMYIETDDRSTT
jgi:hypothetical protein